MFGHFESFKLNGLKLRVTAVRPLKEERELAMATCGFNTNMRTLSTNLFHCKQDVKPSKEMCDFFYREACT